MDLMLNDEQFGNQPKANLLQRAVHGLYGEKYDRTRMVWTNDKGQSQSMGKLTPIIHSGQWGDRVGY